MKRIRRVFILSLAVGLLATASCGGGGSEDISTADARLDVTATDTSLSPASLTVPADGTVGVSFVNGGTEEHYWAILSDPIASEAEFDDDLVLWETEAHEGDTVTALVDVDLAPGTYQVICTLEGHFSAGMHQELIVTG